MTAIQRYPQGYLNLIGAQSGGKTPPASADVLAPVIDLTQFFLWSQRQSATGNTSAVTAGGLWGALTIPDGELWFVHRISGTSGSALAAATVVNGPAMAYYPAANTARLQIGPQGNNCIAGDRAFSSFELDLLLGAGTVFGMYFQLVTVGTAPVFAVNVEYSKLT